MAGVGIALCAFAMAVGLVGTVVPLVPGLSLIWATALVYGLTQGFAAVGTIAFGFMTIALVASLVAKLAVPHHRGKASGAPGRSLAAGAAAGLAGFFVIPVVGLPLGAVAGVLAAEYARTHDWTIAWRSTKAVMVGLGIVALLELGAGIIMILTWIGWVLATR